VSPLKWFRQAVKHKRKVQRAYTRSLRVAQRSTVHGKTVPTIVSEYQDYLAKRRA
jgi:hypothetical protein